MRPCIRPASATMHRSLYFEASHARGCFARTSRPAPCDERCVRWRSQNRATPHHASICMRTASLSLFPSILPYTNHKLKLFVLGAVLRSHTSPRPNRERGMSSGIKKQSIPRAAPFSRAAFVAARASAACPYRSKLSSPSGGVESED